jgi:hypothetical protein
MNVGGKELAWVAGGSLLGIVLLRGRKAGAAVARPPCPVCEYDTYAWSTTEGRSVDHQHVEKDRRQLVSDEISALDPRCTICECDQVRVTLSNGVHFDMCWAWAEQVRGALERALAQGAIIEDVKGYRPGRTGGRTDSAGRRTEYGSHAYGIALDINRDYNGMYSSSGRRLHGGSYDPDRYPRRTITHASPIYQQLRRIGWGWAGDYVDELGYADWMHFSINGR